MYIILLVVLNQINTYRSLILIGQCDNISELMRGQKGEKGFEGQKGEPGLPGDQGQ